jgi:hypothetical protein
MTCVMNPLERPLLISTFAASVVFAIFAVGACAAKEGGVRSKGVGDPLQAFLIKNCESGETYCQVCAYGGKPTIMSVLDADDPALEADLLAIQDLIKSYQGQGLAAFALVGKFADGKLVSAPDGQGTLVRMKQLHQKLALTFPITMLPAPDEKTKSGYKPFAEVYDVTASRTVFFATAENKIRFAEVMQADQQKAQLDRLRQTIAGFLSPSAG